MCRPLHPPPKVSANLWMWTCSSTASRITPCSLLPPNTQSIISDFKSTTSRSHGLCLCAPRTLQQNSLCVRRVLSIERVRTRQHVRRCFRLLKATYEEAMCAPKVNARRDTGKEGLCSALNVLVWLYHPLLRHLELFFSPLRLSKSIICRSTVPTCPCLRFSRLSKKIQQHDPWAGSHSFLTYSNKRIKPLMRVFRSSRPNIESTSDYLHVVRRDNSNTQGRSVMARCQRSP